jgi:hypothetical protein
VPASAANGKAGQLRGLAAELVVGPWRTAFAAPA